MKQHLLIFTVVLGILSPIGKADDADKQRIKELEEKMAALEREKAKPSEGAAKQAAAGRGLFDEHKLVNSAVANAVLIIEGDKSVGTGFIVASAGKKYVY